LPPGPIAVALLRFPSSRTSFGPTALGENQLALRMVEVEIRVDCRIEVSAVQLRIRPAQSGGDGLRLPIRAPLVELGHGLPLPWSRFEPEVAVGGSTDTVLNDAHPALVPFGVEVAEDHHVEARTLAVFGVVRPDQRGGRLGDGLACLCA